MPRRSANRICLPNFAAAGATSQATPRERSAAAVRMAPARLSSSLRATSTTLGVDRLARTLPWARSLPSSRDTPIEMPTPG